MSHNDDLIRDEADDALWKRALDPLPSAEELVGPLLRIICILCDLGERALDIEIDTTDEASESARELLHVMRRCVQLSCAGVRTLYTPDIAERVSTRLRFILEQSMNLDLLESHVDASTALSFMTRDHSAPDLFWLVRTSVSRRWRTDVIRG